MSSTSTSATPPPGWYHAPGDPNGMVRRWNGAEWVGFPVAELETNLGDGHPMASAPRAFRYTKWTAVISALCMIALTTLGAILAALALRISRDTRELDRWWVPAPIETSDAIEGTQPQGFPLEDLTSYIENLSGFVLVTLGAMVVTGVVFLSWLRSAATAAKLVQFRMLRRAKRRDIMQSWFVTHVPGLEAVLPIYFVVRQFTRPMLGKFGGGMFSVTAGTAEAASFNPRTQHSEIDPIKLVLWWGLWWVPLILTIGAWGWVASMPGRTANEVQLLLDFSVLMTALQVISIGCILLTVIQITSRLAKG